MDADIKGYFDNIPQDQLPALVKHKISDRRILGLLGKFLKQGVMEGMNRYQNAWFAERGLVFLISITHDSAASPTK